MDRESILNMDTNILVSIINMKLRDFYFSLEALCDDFGIGEDELKNKMKSANYEYINEQNQFR
ncbi:MAG: DUF4250 domain-containing protein [Clostridium sp.]